jgi:hypothetical protein
MGKHLRTRDHRRTGRRIIMNRLTSDRADGPEPAELSEATYLVEYGSNRFGEKR